MTTKVGLERHWKGLCNTSAKDGTAVPVSPRRSDSVLVQLLSPSEATQSSLDKYLIQPTKPPDPEICCNLAITIV
eukprot:1144956-Pelagomonas_calceolata.AAC.6